MSYSRADTDDLQARLRAMVQRGTVRSVDDAMLMQMLDIKLMNGHRPTKVEHWQSYGLSFTPHAGSEVMAFALGGNLDHIVVIPGADRRYRLKGLASGELAVHDDQGQKVHFKRDGVWIETSKKAVVKSPSVLVGDDNPGMPRVMTEAGPSSVMRAKV